LTGLVVEQSNVMKDINWWDSFIRQMFQQDNDVVLTDGAQTSRCEAPTCPSHATIHYTFTTNVHQLLLLQCLQKTSPSPPYCASIWYLHWKAWHFSLFGQTALMLGETDAKILTAFPLENWRRPPVRPRTTWMKTIQKNPKSNLTSPWMKQLTWLRIIHSGDWCLRLVLMHS